jgi:Raf kinase inhibitor-like YbhB/YbcL family protein
VRRAALALALLAGACSGRGVEAAGSHALAIERAETAAKGRLEVSSSSFPAGGAIPGRYSAYAEGVSPALAWRGVPAGAKALVLIVEDPDASSQKPFVHWLAWNLAPDSRLGANAVPAGAVQGRNGRGGTGWFGPHPPGGKPHPYHFELFALDGPLALPAGSDREALLAAMKGHVLAAGETVGLFAKPSGGAGR